MAKKVLVVDDEPNVVKMVASRLTANGYKVAIACNGREGLEQIKINKPDLVILDILMPEIDGISMVRILKSKPETKDIPVIFLTCLVGKDELSEGEHLIGGNIFIAKPFDANELLSTVKMMAKG